MMVGVDVVKNEVESCSEPMLWLVGGALIEEAEFRRDNGGKLASSALSHPRPSGTDPFLPNLSSR
jgi:hypothetical protein